MIQLKKYGILNQIKFVIWLSIPFFLFFLPVDLFDSGTSICPSQLILNKECPGCGITRSVQHAIHFDFKTSWNYNKLVVIVLPVLTFIWIKTARKLFIELFKKEK